MSTSAEQYARIGKLGETLRDARIDVYAILNQWFDSDHFKSAVAPNKLTELDVELSSMVTCADTAHEHPYHTIYANEAMDVVLRFKLHAVAANGLLTKHKRMLKARPSLGPARRADIVEHEARFLQAWERVRAAFE